MDIQPTLECGMTACATAPKTNTAHFRKVQNTGLPTDNWRNEKHSST